MRESDPLRCGLVWTVILVAEFLRNQAERVGIHGNGTARVGRGNCEGDIARVGRVAGRPPDDALSSPSGEGACGGGSATFGGAGAGERGGDGAGDAHTHDECEWGGIDLRIDTAEL